MKYVITESQFKFLRKNIIVENETPKRLLYYPPNLNPRVVDIMHKAIKYYEYRYAEDFLRMYKKESEVVKEENFWYNEVIKCHNQAIQYFTKHFSNPDTISKLKNPESAKKTIEYIKTIPFAIVELKYPTAGHTIPVKNNSDNFYFISIVLIRENLCNTVRHEMAHLIDFFLTKTLGEKTMELTTPIQKDEDKSVDKTYITSNIEIFANVQGFRDFFKINPKDGGNVISSKIENYLKTKQLPISVTTGYLKNKNNIIFKVSDKWLKTMNTSQMIVGLKGFYEKIFNNHDVQSLFANFSDLNLRSKTITLYCDKLGQTNITTVDSESKNKDYQDLA